MRYNIGDTIRILWMADEPRVNDYINRQGIITSIDSLGQLHGTWGGLALIPEVDDILLIRRGE